MNDSHRDGRSYAYLSVIGVLACAIYWTNKHHAEHLNQIKNEYDELVGLLYELDGKVSKFDAVPEVRAKLRETEDKAKDLHVAIYRDAK